MEIHTSSDKSEDCISKCIICIWQTSSPHPPSSRRPRRKSRSRGSWPTSAPASGYKLRPRHWRRSDPWQKQTSRPGRSGRTCWTRCRCRRRPPRWCSPGTWGSHDSRAPDCRHDLSQYCGTSLRFKEMFTKFKESCSLLGLRCWEDKVSILGQKRRVSSAKCIKVDITILSSSWIQILFRNPFNVNIKNRLNAFCSYLLLCYAANYVIYEWDEMRQMSGPGSVTCGDTGVDEGQSNGYVLSIQKHWNRTCLTSNV